MLYVHYNAYLILLITQTTEALSWDVAILERQIEAVRYKGDPYARYTSKQDREDNPAYSL